MTESGSILIVDDELPNLELARDLLSDAYSVRTATSGEQALSQMSTYTPDLVLLDIGMKGLNGYEVCLRIRQIPQFDGVKIILLSGRKRMEDKMRGYQAGADDYLTKPYDPEELLMKVSAYLRHVRSERALQLLNAALHEQIRLRTEQLQRAERLAFIGHHVASVAHDLQNPLTILRGMARIGLSELPENKRFVAIEKAAERLDGMLSGILANSAPDLNEPGLAVEVNAVLRSELGFLTSDHTLKYEITVEQNLAAKLEPARCTESALRQIIGNLIKNAIEAMSSTVEKKLKIRSSSDAGEIILTIEDSGCGIPGEHMHRLFDPFFTTKKGAAGEKVASGTGLGLAGVKQTLEAYKGTIAVRSVVGEGTVVLVRLPAVAVDATKAA